ncbi:metal-dependent hydrolase [Priestia aryabhattai]|uniref:metal-dependent hydrolase n=1 Tax=Priestia aryabhattai TaxID=412384 RepID=UPI001CD6660D|nr:metal-dependent hydrolase [Priestia aryabhattai]MCA1049381.1 metal-dependent hydrolase [Priestia aryabhattai]
MITAATGAAVLAKLLSVPYTAGYLVGTLIGSLLPDIDEPKSFIGRRSFGIAHLIKQRFGHRGFTHSLVCWIIFSILVYVSIPLTNFACGLCFGYLFHILGDLFSKSSVPLFLPFSKLRPKMVWSYRTGGRLEKVIFFVVGGCFFYFLFVEQMVVDIVSSVVIEFESQLKSVIK